MKAKRNPVALAGANRASGNLSWRDNPEDSLPPAPFQHIGDVAAHVVRRLCREHGITPPHAATVARLSGLGGGHV